MVFSSVPVYLDPPNWQQQPANNHQGTTNTSTENLLLPPLQPPRAASGSSGSIRPDSMADRARLAKLPQPEAALKCPRCESINTKFCYFNNYSLSQPRHFCKTCRRYWTRGGALRNVPVGGGCRRNKRSKSTGSSKSQVSADRQTTGSSSTSSIPSSSGCASDIISQIAHHQPPQQFPFMANLHHLGHDYGAPDHHHQHMGLNFGGIQQTGGRPELDFLMGSINSSSGGASVLSSVGEEQWRLQQVQQFPFLAGLEPPPGGLYPFEGEGVDPPGFAGQVRARASGSVPLHGNFGPVKMEENQGLNLPRSFLGINVPGNDQYNLGSINAWTDLSGFSTSSASHLL